MTAIEAQLIEQLKKLPPGRSRGFRGIHGCARGARRCRASVHPGAGQARCLEPAADLRRCGRGRDSGSAAAAAREARRLIVVRPVRFVHDTNLLVSGVIATGLSRRLVDGAKAGEFERCTSEVLLAELPDVHTREKFAARLTHAGLTPEGVVDDLGRLAVIVVPTDTPGVVPTDPDDDHVIAAEVVGQIGRAHV